MKIDRRTFLRKSSVILFSLSVPMKIIGGNIYQSFDKSLNRIKIIIASLKSEGSNLVKKIMNGKKYVRDPYFHYPFDGGIKDKETGCRIFFHAHRENEYGHFHTFVEDESGELIHLVLISMNKQGIPIGLSTVNRWVTGDKYVNGSTLKKHLESYKINYNSYKEKRVIEFIELMFKSYKEEIYQLFDERDLKIRNYVNQNFRDPFEDRDLEILSSFRIKIYN